MEKEKKKQKEKKQKINKNGLERKLRKMTMIPVILMGIVVAFLSYRVMISNTQKEVYRNLHNMAEAAELYFDLTYPGDYLAEESAGEVFVSKGGINVTGMGDVLDAYKNETGLEFTLFYKDVRILTTLSDKDGNDIVFTTVNGLVSDAVINHEQEMFYNNIDINGTRYFACYNPIYNSDGSVVGMIFCGKPTKEVEHDSLMALFWIPFITIIMVLIASWMSLVPARGLVKAIKDEKKFLDEISKGNLNIEIDPSLVKRDDELGEMGRFSRSVQKFIRDMIERDPLTRLYTRRIGASKVDYTQKLLNEAGVKYCVCMGDIDFFKKVNDTYGHDAGDIVLHDVAHIFNENMLGHGFTIRWGGEEFLIIFEDADLEKAYNTLAKIRELVLAHEMTYGDDVIKVTMTFGLIEGDGRNIEDIVKEADNLLYYGKQNGRNQIVTSREVNKMTYEKELSLIKEKNSDK